MIWLLLDTTIGFAVVGAMLVVGVARAMLGLDPPPTRGSAWRSTMTGDAKHTTEHAHSIMDDHIRHALDQGQLIDMTTTGRTSGLARRIEIMMHNFGGRLYISGMPNPRKRAWIANLESDPSLTIHLKGSVHADLAATARVITDDAERRTVMPLVAAVWQRTDVEEMVARSPLIEVSIRGYGDARAA